MKHVLLAAAALFALAAVPTAPAQAEDRRDPGFSVRSGDFSTTTDFRFGRRDGDRRDRRRRDRDSDLFIGEWPQQGDTLWRPESFNDWWHDSPSRAFPRWVQTGNCERMWWSGGGWRC